jgi:hypothetical protein
MSATARPCDASASSLGARCRWALVAVLQEAKCAVARPCLHRWARQFDDCAYAPALMPNPN